MSRSRLLSIAALLGLVLPAAGAWAQDADTVGPPALRNFSISGEQTNAPAPAEEPAAVTPPPVVEIPPVRIAPEPTQPAASAETNASSPAASPADERSAGTRDNAPADRAAAAPVPEPTMPVEETRSFGPSEVPVIVSPELREPAQAPSAAEGRFPWLYAVAAGIAGLALLAFLLLRRREDQGEEELELANVLMPEAEPLPAPLAREPEPEPRAAAVTPPAQPRRPRLELEFKPGKAAATDAQASVEYELKIANVGDAEARRVRIEARLFNAQQDAEIGAFFSAPDPALATLAPRAIPPQSGALFKSVVALPKEQVREVVIQGRRLFIPMIAFNVLYEWGEGEAGQTSMSYLVGRETEPPAEKMAPFRLDLGPRIYRSVGFRPSKLALTV
ncbi:hypothetical protein [Sphingosinicella rhizophila]|uniref:Uncharacterized protein n=1 Tax=Sphingosinicella rhizophila TaxID=3050082 RepID=A0ABU3Q457_9SPHN|nr:hypothetical protein [Sphingosinicella sp. GR2756]MDT9597844.1 hypothetical protein [Sphingosinicella sp. GR2756]